MDANFDKCLAFVLKEEGGNDDDPNDHGGRTSRGITQREWDKFRIIHPDRPEDVWKASDVDIRAIYHDNYWMPHCNSLPSGLDLEYFDFGVNAGPGQAIKKLQVTLGITPDGSWGPQTEEAVKALIADKNIGDAINKFSDSREAFYRGLAQFFRYGKGWTNRNEACRKEALSMIGSTFPSPRANPVDTKPPIHGPAAGAIIVAGGTAVAANYHSPLIFLGVLVVALIVGLTVHSIVNRKAT